MQFVDIYNNIKHPINMIFLSPQNSFGNLNISSSYHAYKCQIPSTWTEFCKRDHETLYNELAAYDVLDSSNWHLLFHFISNGPASITLFHPKLFTNDDQDGTITGALAKYHGINTAIPGWTNSHRSTRPIYNNAQQTLYTIYDGAIFALDFKDNFDNFVGLSSEWKLWKITDKTIQHGASLCMVDNDRFMAVINANGKESYLYALNETKIGIELADACEYRSRDYSLYHEYKHKIITIGSKSGEWYDLNKDKSMILTRFEPDYHYEKNVWYSPFHPSILYCIHPWRSEDNGIEILAIDLRNGQVCKCESKVRDIAFSNWHQSYWLM